MRPISPFLPAVLVAALWSPVPSHAAESPEITRAVGKPQTVGALHTLRVIPEACVRIEGQFTGLATPPYTVNVVRTHPNCQPRAHWIDGANAKPAAGAGWILNDVVRVPSAACATQLAVLRIWRRAGDVATPALDGQGRARLYLADSMKGRPATTNRPVFTAVTAVEGRGCKGD